MANDIYRQSLTAVSEYPNLSVKGTGLPGEEKQSAFTFCFQQPLQSEVVKWLVA